MRAHITQAWELDIPTGTRFTDEALRPVRVMQVKKVWFESRFLITIVSGHWGAES